MWKSHKDAQDAIRTAERALTTLGQQLGQLEAQLADARRRAIEAEQRAATHQQVADDNLYQAVRTRKLENAANDLVAALERLPASMQDAGMIETLAPPEILLYGTWEWRAVIEAWTVLTTMLDRTISRDATAQPGPS